MIKISSVNKIFAILVFCLLSCFLAEGQSNVRFPLTDPQYGISQTTNATVTVQAENISQSGTVTLLPLTLQQVTDATGLTTFSNLYGSSISGFYHWTVAIYNSSQKVQGDMWVSSINLGTVNESIIDIVNGAPSYPAGTWCWSAQASDLRYAASVYSLTNYATINQLLNTSNSIVSLIPSTNGFVTASITNGFAGTNYANSVTNGFNLSLVTSNPASFATPTQVSNIVNNINSTNPVTLAAVTNIVITQIISSNAPLASTNFVLTQIINATNQLANTNLFSGYATTNQFVNGTNSIYGNLANQISATNSATLLNINSASNVNFSYASGISNFLISAKQPGSLVLSNLAATGAITNILASGINMALTTNISGNTIIFNATNQTFLTNNLASTNFVLASIASSNAGFATLQNISSSNTTALQTTTNLILALSNSIPTGLANTNIYLAGVGTYLTTNFTGNIQFINASNQTFLTNGLATSASLILSNTLNLNQTTNLILSASNSILSSGIWNTNGGVWDTNGAAQAALVAANNAVVNGTWEPPLAAQASSLPQIFNIGSAPLLFGTVFINSYDGLDFNSFPGGILADQFYGSLSGGYILPHTIPDSALTNQFLSVLQTNAFANSIIATATNAAFAFAQNSTNAGNIVFTNNPQYWMALTNASAYLLTTNGKAIGLNVSNYLSIGTKTNWLWTTNDIGLIGSGSPFVSGTYVGSGSTIWTNPFYPQYTITLSGGNYYAQSNNVALYASVDAIHWTMVNGVAPAPTGYFASDWLMDGANVKGWFYSTNLIWQIGNYSISTQGVVNLIATYATTNSGITAVAATNIFRGMTNGTIPNFAFITNYVFNATNAFSAGAGLVLTNFTGFGQVPFSTNLTGGYTWQPVSGLFANYVTTAYVNGATNGLVTSAVTNGLATLAYVQNATNGLATTNYVNLVFGSAITNVAFTNAGNPTVINQVGWFPTNSFGGTGGGGSATNAWGLNGNTTTNSFIGTLTYQPFVIKVGGNTVGQFVSPNAGDVRINMGYGNGIAVDSGSSSNQNSAILSGKNNNITGSTTGGSEQDDSRGDVISGGDSNTNNSTGFGYIGTGWKNLLSSYPYESIENGVSNHVNSVWNGTIVNGRFNYVFGWAGNGGTYNGCATILNGESNTNGGFLSTIINGKTNYINTGYSTIVGGQFNTISNSGGGSYPTSSELIGSGINNLINGSAYLSTILNGSSNLITKDIFTPTYSELIVSGESNQISGASSMSTILNGGSNIISGAIGATAIGSQITIANSYSTVLNDGYPVSTTNNNTLTLSFSNGVSILTHGLVTVNGTNVLSSGGGGGSGTLTTLVATNATVPSVSGAVGFIPNQMVYFGTNNPNGITSAPFGAIYNQFSAAATNYFIGQWINTNNTTGWQ